MIYQGLCKKSTLVHTNIWYLYNPKSVQENETHKLLWDFEIQTDHLISVRRSDLIKFNEKKKEKKRKRTFRIEDFAHPVNHRVRIKENEKRDKYLDLAWEQKKLWNMKVMIIPSVIRVFGMISKCLVKGRGKLEIGGWAKTILTTALLRSVKTAEKNPWGFGRLVVTHTPEKEL